MSSNSDSECDVTNMRMEYKEPFCAYEYYYQTVKCFTLLLRIVTTYITGNIHQV